ncbi:probable 50S ribosomal protein L32 (chloroplast) [Coccomyxa sp. Obi]|uniref:Large ribosomal subunit protein bL32c n=1 Tax=Paradoxia multiseta TaxID=249350 RepID=A0A097KP10_9CHLO|nr:ribosomal protein L32 [Paradoxia multiseta]AIT94949.1 ribosomal protein L32 [Paradoxia multiseta]BDA51884.1 probable 50S ribosomal protein L32 [Coccomyxa sp. Obi]
MAVPKKRTSKSRRNTRRTLWKKKASAQTKRSFSLAASILKKRLKQKERIEPSPTET